MDAEGVSDEIDAGQVSGETAEDHAESESDAVIARLSVIDQQPLESRATAFGLVYGRLQRRLEGGDA